MKKLKEIAIWVKIPIFMKLVWITSYKIREIILKNCLWPFIQIKNNNKIQMGLFLLKIWIRLLLKRGIYVYYKNIFKL